MKRRQDNTDPMPTRLDHARPSSEPVDPNPARPNVTLRMQTAPAHAQPTGPTPRALEITDPTPTNIDVTDPGPPPDMDDEMDPQTASLLAALDVPARPPAPAPQVRASSEGGDFVAYSTTAEPAPRRRPEEVRQEAALVELSQLIAEPTPVPPSPTTPARDVATFVAPERRRPVRAVVLVAVAGAVTVVVLGGVLALLGSRSAGEVSPPAAQPAQASAAAPAPPPSALPIPPVLPAAPANAPFPSVAASEPQAPPIDSGTAPAVVAPPLATRTKPHPSPTKPAASARAGIGAYLPDQL